MGKKQIKIGLFGAGHFGKFHANNLLQSPFELVGFYDPDDANSTSIVDTLKIKRFDSIDELIRNVDAVDIVSPTIHHLEIAEKAALSNKHIFIEKPIAANSKEAIEFIDNLKGKKIIVQVGHIERFNPAYKNAVEYCTAPEYIKASRMAPYNPRANDVSIVHDLMIHDIDAILSLVGSKVKKISATGKSVLTNQIDRCEARIEFENGCIANLESSRVHSEQIRETQIHCEGKFITIDYLKKSLKVFDLKEVSNGEKKKEDLFWNAPKGSFSGKEVEQEFPASNAILEELTEFYNSITNDKPIRVDHNDAFQALYIADEIIRKVV